jgi:hypothetical protein
MEPLDQRRRDVRVGRNAVLREEEGDGWIGGREEGLWWP